MNTTSTPLAFPSGSYVAGDASLDDPHPNSYPMNDGMTLRQYYAAKAMQGLITSGVISGVEATAFAIADAMIEFEQ